MTRQRETLVQALDRDPESRLDLAAARLAIETVSLMNRAFRASGLTQKELAAALGVSESRVSQILNGDGNVRSATTARVLRAAGYRPRLDAEPADEGVAPLPRPVGRRRASQEGAAGQSTTPAFRYVSTETRLALLDDGFAEDVVVSVSTLDPSRHVDKNVDSFVFDSLTSETRVVKAVVRESQIGATQKVLAGVRHDH